MKKSLIALAAMAAVGAASAQSGVTLYGIVDAGIKYEVKKTPKGKERVFGRNSGGLSSSRWGLKGQEDLGNGLYAVFDVQAGFDSIDGEFKNGFGRRSVVGLKGGFGQVLIGYDTLPVDIAVDGHTAMGLGAKYQGKARGLHYTGNFSGVGIHAFAGYGYVREDNPDIKPPAGVKKVVEVEGRGYGVGLGLSYETGPFSIGAAVQKFETKRDVAALIERGVNIAKREDTRKAETTEFGVGASYDFTSAKLFAHYVSTKDKGAKAKQQMGVGVSVPMGAFTIDAQYAYNRQDKDKGHNFGVRGIYSLSKRTDLYAVAKRSGVWKDRDTETDTFAVGIRHKF